LHHNPPIKFCFAVLLTCTASQKFTHLFCTNYSIEIGLWEEPLWGWPGLATTQTSAFGGIVGPSGHGVPPFC
ncbi:MAG: hypothetical protein KKD11_07765, partial [Candidatus Omnitrophica bacterium]|nr:hypothetical protein [Candidatus Omnitrophota bacterium]